jgi:hypothetical protein
MRAKTKTNKTKKSKDLPQHPSLITVILLCDLPGYRMKSYGPTSLIDITPRKKLIDFQIDAIKKVFLNFEIILCCGFDCEKMCKYVREKYSSINIRIVENQAFGSSNSCESARLCINNTNNDNILILDGNLLFNQKTIKLIPINQTCVVIENKELESFDIGVNTDEKNHAQHFSFGAYKVWSEILYLHGKDIVENVRKFLIHPESKKKFLFEAINDVLKNKHEIRCIENQYVIHKINNIKTYHDIKEKNEIFNI